MIVEAFNVLGKVRRGAYNQSDVIEGQICKSSGLVPSLWLTQI